MNGHEKLIAEADAVVTTGGCDSWDEHADLILRLAAALEAATRQPSENDREAAFESGMEMVDWGMVRDGVGDPQEAAGIAVRAALGTLAAVPDAATDGRLTQAELEDIAETHAFCADRLSIETELVDEIRAERDAALAAIERVRAVLSAWEMVQARNREHIESGNPGMIVPIDCTGGLRAALDGAPEPEEKP